MDWTESDYSARTAMRLARSGALVRVKCHHDACQACQAMGSRIYTPSEVPRLPIRGCTRERCRCTFEAVDPETELTVTQLVERGIHAIRAGRTELARKILRYAVSLDEMHEQGWLWLSAVVDDQHKIACLNKVLAINPRNERARAGLAALREKLSAVRKEKAPVEAATAPSETAAIAPEAAETAPDAAAPLLPPELSVLRVERSVIVEQWEEFVGFATELTPEILQVQARAFLERFDRLNERARKVADASSTDSGIQLDELNAEWQDTEAIGAALADSIDEYRSHRQGSPGWESMRDALRQVAQRVLTARNQLREQITDAGGRVPE